jgi:dienelactone hydrolase
MSDPRPDQRYIDLFDEFTHGTNAARYDKEAAELAWSRTVEFLRRHLG